MLRYLETFFRNRWMISLPAVLLIVLSAGLTHFVKKKYQAGSTIWTDSSMYLDVGLTDSHYYTPAQLHSSRINELLTTDAFPRSVAKATPMGSHMTQQQEDALVSAIHSDMHIYPTGDHILQVTFSHLSPQVALSVVQAVIEQYNRVTNDSASAQAAQAVAFYKEQINVYEKTILPRSAQAVTEYLKAHPNSHAMPGDQPNSDDPNLALLLQQAERDRTQYESYQKRLDDVLNQSQAQSKSQEFAFKVIDKPAVTNAGTPKLSKKTMIMYSGAGLGMAGGYIVVFLLLATELDRTIRNPGDVSHRLHLPVLEVVPDYNQKARGRFSRRNKGGKGPSVTTAAQSYPSI